MIVTNDSPIVARITLGLESDYFSVIESNYSIELHQNLSIHLNADLPEAKVYKGS
jgi:hypothetical protein